MTTRVLVTTTSFQDTPGPHHQRLESQGYELIRARGPLDEAAVLPLVGDVDGILCGDDAYTRAVLAKALPRLRVLSKYGIGLDKIDVHAATELGIPVTFCPGVNHTTVAEHAFGLMLALVRQIPQQNAWVHQGQWKRLTGHELMGKTLGILGLGRIGKEVAARARAFGMTVIAFDPAWDAAFAAAHQVSRADTPQQIFAAADIVTLHMNLTAENRRLVGAPVLASMKDGAIIINTARGGLIDEQAVADAVRSGKLAGYGADVVEPEPIKADNPLRGLDGVVLTPHIGSRTYESVERQALMAVENLIAVLSGRPAVAQANRPAPRA